MALYPEVMLDIETLSTHVDAVVLSIGAVRFDLRDEDSHDTFSNDQLFYAKLKVRSQELAGRHISYDTVDWWMRQNPMAKRALFGVDGRDVKDVLMELAAFIQDANIWGNGNTFDNIILRSLYNDFNLPYPVRYTKDLDLRTLKYMAGKKDYGIPKGVEHNALEDAKFQALVAQAAFRELKDGSESRSNVREFPQPVSVT